MAPPAKRRKRNVVVSSSSSSSESEDSNKDEIFSSTPPAARKVALEELADTTSSTASKTLPSKLKRPAAKTSSHPPTVAPKYLPKQKTAKKPIATSHKSPKKGSKQVAGAKNADIQTLFSNQAKSQAEVGRKLPRRTLLRTPSLAEDDNDPISDEEDIKALGSQPSLVAAAAKKRKQGLLPSVAESDLPPAKKKFLKPVAEVPRDDDTRPWADKFGPINLEELAVHKKKVSDVRAWLESVMQGRMRQRLLILKGAAGTGKTTTLQLLAKDMNCEVLEWRNADGSIASSDGFVSMSAQFEEFLGRGGKFGQLDVFSSAENPPKEPIPESVEHRKQIILIEEFPSTFTRSSTALQSFRTTILQYLAANTPSLLFGNQGSQPITPVVMVVSETLLTTASASADSFTAHRLLGPEILQHPGIHVIEFNDIAKTILAKALDLVIQKESRKSGRRKIPGPLVLKRLAEVGDVRSAVGSLEFLCLRGDSTDWGGKVVVGKAKKGSKTEPVMTKVEEESLELVTRREASLGIFHAVGKVMYNKRDDIEPSASTAERLPDYLSLHARPRKTQVLVDDLMNETGTDTQTFIAALHENYILSCDAPPNSLDYTSIDHVNNCIDALSDSDLLSPSWDDAFNSNSTGSGGDILRQDELSFQTSVRGILFGLPYPVKRRAPAAAGLRTGKGGDAFKMFYPTSLKLWRMKEEIEGTIDTWVTRLKNGEIPHSQSITAGAKAFAKPKPGSVESWGRSSTQRYNNTNPSSSSDRKLGVVGKKEQDTTPLLATGTSARKEMLLERLPYMVQIARKSRYSKPGNHTSYANLTIREMEKVTTFSGIGGPTEEAPDDDDKNIPVGEEWATDKAGIEELPAAVGNGRLMTRKKVPGGGLGVVEKEVQKLVLSDDDIEDD